MLIELKFFLDILLDDSYEGNLRKEGRSVRIVVAISGGPKTTKVCGTRPQISTISPDSPL